MSGSRRETLWDLIADRREGILATIGSHGLPHLSNVYYAPDTQGSRVIRISTTATRAKGRNLLRDARAVLHVPGPDFFNFAVAEGRVSLTLADSPGDPATDELYAVHGLFNGASERPAFDHKMIEDRRMVVRIEVTKLYGLVHHGGRRPRHSENGTDVSGVSAQL